jgi:hypothetical protein
MAKKGILFEQAVADIVRSFDTTADVVQGKWISGPDGRRDRDVSFTGMIGGKPYKALIECKDYNPRTTGRVGIGMIDALDSKRRDLKIDFPMICSNAGFAKPAIKKAQRVGISTIGALRMGDSRLKFEVHDMVYTRKLTIPIKSVRFYATPPIGGMLPQNMADISLDDITFNGLQVRNWVIKRIFCLLSANPIVNGYVHDTTNLVSPIELHASGAAFAVARLDIDFEVRGAWYHHLATIDSSGGFYDWVRKRPRVAPGSSRVFQIRKMDIHRGKKIARPPEYILTPLPYLPGEMDLRFVKCYGALLNGIPPPLDQYIQPADRSFAMTGLDDAAFTSTPGFEPQP